MTGCGLGPLAELLEGQAGVDLPGFVQPADLTEIYAQSSCLVAPSTFEPWSYVPHETAAAGLAVITTTAIGSGIHLVEDSFSGYIIPPDDAESLANAMLEYSALGDERRRIMSDNSHALSLQFTPRQWAEIFHTRASDLIARKARSYSRGGTGFTLWAVSRWNWQPIDIFRESLIGLPGRGVICAPWESRG